MLIFCGTYRGLQRWNFSFKSLNNAKLYINNKDRVLYKIFVGEDLKTYLKKGKDKICKQMN